MNVVTAKDSARFDCIRPAGFEILWAIVAAMKRCKVSLQITAGTDSHALPDPHVTGEAYDVSVKGLSAQDIEDVYTSLTTDLGPLFTVLYERPDRPSDPTLVAIAYINPKATGAHFHIQRRKGTTYPPAEVPSPKAA